MKNVSQIGLWGLARQSDVTQTDTITRQIKKRSKTKATRAQIHILREEHIFHFQKERREWH